VKQLPSIISTDPLGSIVEVPESAEAAELEEGADPIEPSELRPFVIDAAQHGQRLDRALAALVPEFSRSYLQQLIEAGAVELQGKTLKKVSAAVKAGQTGRIELRPTPQSQAFRPEAMDIVTVYEDEHLRIVDKPAGLVVHPAPGHWSGTLLNGLLALDPKAVLLPRAGIVHRLDRDTSGLMVVARTRATMDAMVALIAARDVKRQYLAIGHKPWEGAAARQVDAPIGRDLWRRAGLGAVAPGAACVQAGLRAPDHAGAAGVSFAAAARPRAGFAVLGAGLQSRLTARGPRRPPEAGLALQLPRACNAYSFHPSEQAPPRRLFPDNANHEYGGCQAHSRNRLDLFEPAVAGARYARAVRRRAGRGHHQGAVA
jgi:23S rRNA-/tRNA-specific pseudouridylate synthase